MIKGLSFCIYKYMLMIKELWLCIYKFLVPFLVLGIRPGVRGVRLGVRVDPAKQSDLLMIKGLQFCIYKYVLMAKGLRLCIYKSDFDSFRVMYFWINPRGLFLPLL